MSAQSEFGRLLADLWGDLQEPDVIWQVAVLAVCLGLAWLAGYLVRSAARSARTAPGISATAA